jgi:hypothetical protein
MFTPSVAGALARAAKIDMLRQRISDDTQLPKRARLLAGVLLDEGRLYSKATNAELIERLPKYDKRSIQYGFRDLEAGGYGDRKPGANTAGMDGYLPPLWTFYTVLHPVITIALSATDIAVVCEQTGEIMYSTQTTSESDAPRASRRAGGSTYWQELHDKIEHMSDAELGEMRYNTIDMQRRDATHAKFWRIQEYIYAGALSDRGIIQPAAILRRLRGFPKY